MENNTEKLEKVNIILQSVAKAYKDFKSAFVLGKTSDELLVPFTHSLEESLSDYEIVYDYIWGDDTKNIDGKTVGYIPKTGDTLIMDISVGKWGVFCDVCRSFFVGEPTKEQIARFGVLKHALERGGEAIRVGAVASDVHRAVDCALRAEGGQLVHHAGHRIGAAPLLQPQFLPENDTPLIAGELYTVEPGLYEGFGLRLENDFFLTDGGAVDLFENLLPLNIKEYIL